MEREHDSLSESHRYGVARMSFEDLSALNAELGEQWSSEGNGESLNALSDELRRLIRDDTERAAELMMQLAESDNGFNHELVAANVDELLAIAISQSAEAERERREEADRGNIERAAELGRKLQDEFETRGPGLAIGLWVNMLESGQGAAQDMARSSIGENFGSGKFPAEAVVWMMEKLADRLDTRAGDVRRSRGERTSTES